MDGWEEFRGCKKRTLGSTALKQCLTKDLILFSNSREGSSNGPRIRQLFSAFFLFHIVIKILRCNFKRPKCDFFVLFLFYMLTNASEINFQKVDSNDSGSKSLV